MSRAGARLDILTRINRAAAGVDAPLRPPYPQSAPLTRAEVLEQFQDRILDYQAAFWRVTSSGVPQAVTEALSGARRVVVPAALPLAWLPPGLEPVRDDPQLAHHALDAMDAVITGCAAAISETGTILLDHGADQGRRALTLIPDRHVCIVHDRQIVQTVWEGVQAVAPSVSAGDPLTWISGGSATSDIELVRVEGVHGPRSLCVIVVNDGPARSARPTLPSR